MGGTGSAGPTRPETGPCSAHDPHGLRSELQLEVTMTVFHTVRGNYDCISQLEVTMTVFHTVRGNYDFISQLEVTMTVFHTVRGNYDL